MLTARLYDCSDVRCLICFVQLGGYLTVIVNKDKNIALKTRCIGKWGKIQFLFLINHFRVLFFLACLTLEAGITC